MKNSAILIKLLVFLLTDTSFRDCCYKIYLILKHNEQNPAKIDNG